MAAKKSKDKQQERKDGLIENKETQKQEEKQPEAKQPKAAPTHYFVKKNHPRGIQIGNMLVPYRAGQKINDLALAYQLRGLGIELVETIQECDLFDLGD